MMQEGLPHISRNRKREGSVLTEAAILLPLFAMLFGFVLYMGYRHQTDMTNARRSRTLAWQQALPGCSTGNRDIPRWDKLGSVPSRLPVASPKIGHWLQTLTMQSINALAQASVRRPSPLGGGTRTLTSTMHVSCNETVRDTEKQLWPTILEAYCVTGAC